MSTSVVLTWVVFFLYFSGGVVGWALNLVARRSKRYYPAIAHAGTALGLLPTYLLLLVILRKLGYARPTGDVWELLTLAIVLLASAAAGVMALVHVVKAAREEWRARRAVGIPPP